MLQYFEFFRIIYVIAYCLWLISLTIELFFIDEAIKYIDNRLPSLMHPYVLLIACLYTGFTAAYKIYVIFN